MAIPTNEALDAFLGAPKPEPAAEPDRQQQETQPAPPAEATPEAPKPEAKPEPAEDTEPPEALEGEPIVPRRAFESIRRERQDWKARAVEAETRRTELERQLAEAKQPPVQQAPPQPFVPIDPVQDPQGYHQRIQGMLVNERLNLSELQLRKELGAEKVDALVNEFKQEAAKDPSLFPKLYQQLDPYGWAAKHLETIRMQREIGDDPAAYKARLRAEFEADFKANGYANGTAPTIHVSPVAGMAPSLATARSVAGRSAPAFTGPPSMDDILRRK
jgi:hypothetical protein